MSAVKTTMGVVSVDALADGRLYVAGNEIVGVIPGCEIGDEVRLSCPVRHDFERPSLAGPGCDEYHLDGVVLGTVHRNGTLVRRMLPSEAEALWTICGGDDALSAACIADAQENWPERD